MALRARTAENAAATKTFGTLRIDRRVLSTPTRTIAIANISTVSVGTHVTARPRGLYWLTALVFAVLALGSARPDFTWGPLAPTAATAVLGAIALAFVWLALRPDDKTHYLLVSTSDGVLTRFAGSDRSFLDEVRAVLSDKINRGDEALTLSVNFEKGQIDGGGPASRANGTLPSPSFGAPANGERPLAQPQATMPRGGPLEVSQPGGRAQRGQINALSAPARRGGPTSAEGFVDYSGVLPAIVEMHRHYARQSGSQHLEQRLSELELLMRSGTPTMSQKTRLRELTNEMAQILGAYPQAVDLFDHVGRLAA